MAESAIDHALLSLSEDREWSTGESSPDSFESRNAEKQWVLGAAAQGSNDPARSGSTREGDWVIVKPSGAAQLIYGVGYSPSKGSAQKTRVVRVEYDFGPYPLFAAVTTSRDLVLAGAPEITGREGNVHSNGDTDIVGTPVVSGFLAAAGAVSNIVNAVVGDLVSSGGGVPAQEIPELNPRLYYGLAEYDLCEDGTVRKGPAYTVFSGGPGPGGPVATVTGGPCSGAVITDARTNRFRGWILKGGGGADPAEWAYEESEAYDGVYYIYRGNATITSSSGDVTRPWRASVIAEGLTTLGQPSCPHRGGDITITGSPDMAYDEGGQPLQFLAGGDLRLSINPIAGTASFRGVMAAQEQFQVVGDVRVGGGLISGDHCSTTGQIGGEAISRISGPAQITYEGGLTLPASRSVRKTHWLEI